MMNISVFLNKKEFYDFVDVGIILVIIFFCIFMVIGIIVNGYVFGIFFFCYNWKLIYVMFVLVLVLIDLVVCVCDILFEILDLMYFYDFYSEVGCKFFKFMSVIFSFSFIFIFVFLLWE